MLEDSARVIDLNPEDPNNPGSVDGGKVEHRALKSKDDIKNYVKGLL